MTIEITYIKETPREIKEKVVEELINDFNKIAIEKNIKYKIKLKYEYPHLVQNFWIFENYSNQICFHDSYFTFIDELNEEIFNEIKPILDEIPQIFKIELKEEENAC